MVENGKNGNLNMVHLELKSVYHYRNRWSCGICEGELDLKGRIFTPKKKAGIFRIKTRADIMKFLDFPEDSFAGKQAAENLNQFGFTKTENIKRLQILLGDYCTLEKFIELHLSIPNEKPKYLSNLILNTLVVKKMWVSRYSAKTRWYRYPQ